MKTNRTLPLLAALLSAGALAQTPATSNQLPADWNNAALASASYVILEPRIDGNANVLSADQQTGILAAMKRDSAGAIKRHYPNAQIVSDPNTPGAIKVTPTLTAPNALVPWAKVSARLDFQFPSGQTVAMVNTFGIMTLAQQSWNAANYAFDQLAQKLP